MPQMNVDATPAPQTREQTAAPDSHNTPIAEGHSINRTGWLRAAVFGVNGGLLSTASLMAGVAAVSAFSAQPILTGFDFGDNRVR